MKTVNSIKSDLSCFGGRLRAARKELDISAQRVSMILNSYLRSRGLATVSLNTFYSWEHIGTSKELAKGKSYPHPVCYDFFSSLYGVNAEWLFYGGMGGQIMRYRKDTPVPKSRIKNKEQREAYAESMRIMSEAENEFRLVFENASLIQKKALIRLLRAITQGVKA